ncbi:dTDP-4-dehydrorhamnose 3,5-epimerase [Selenomonas sp. TAMA-11512]|uniref:dTDP-4-dehydrorhamnose 3,5-epimerase n=1 Tax=Selenomonas sp. TAMA-11512 TaxID=3095337 RepID=UPI0030874CCA|nr:dTDP-4-dehydrorhamnose 3,5-epimerase [Selenomonas sp. TAMA-11512]
MNRIDTALPGVCILEPRVFGDLRGWFMESWSRKKLETVGIYADFVQDNQSFSKERGTLRGLHYQRPPMAQAKLLRCTRGEILDVAVDVREGSPTYAAWVAVKLSAENKRQLFIPRGFLHGFITLTDDVEVLYKADNYYAPEADGNVLWKDPQIGIDWGMEPVVLSDKDRTAPLLAEAKTGFRYEEEKG